MVMFLSLGSMACHAPTDTAPLRASAAQGPAGSIRLTTSSNVCVAVATDEQLWREETPAVNSSGLSGILASEIFAHLAAQGVSNDIQLPESTSSEPRFVNDYNKANPVCRDPEDILVSVNYAPRPDGTPFLVDYDIRQGSESLAGSADFDVAHEIRSGRIEPYNRRRRLQNVVLDDLRSRAATLASLIASRAIRRNSGGTVPN
jgi:hypothetical protein